MKSTNCATLISYVVINGTRWDEVPININVKNQSDIEKVRQEIKFNIGKDYAVCFRLSQPQGWNLMA